MGGGTGQIKLVEDGSPLIRDRLIFNYNDFFGVALGSGKISVNRFTLGGEKTLFNGNASIEVRVPMALTNDPGFDHDTLENNQSFVLGDITTFFKVRLYGDDVWQLTTGLRVTAPTAQLGCRAISATVRIKTVL